MSNNLSKIQKEEVSPKEEPIFTGGSSDIYYPWPKPYIAPIPVTQFKEKEAQDYNNDIINQINNLTSEKLNVDNFEIPSNDFNISTESNISNLLGNAESPTDLS